MRALVVALVLAAPFRVYAHDAFAAPAEAKPMPAKELAEFLGPVSPTAFTWKQVLGPDFEVYFGRANPPLSGEVSFYLGGWPGPYSEPNSTVVDGKLGIFPAQWHRVTDQHGLVTQHALIPLDDYWKVDISVRAKSHADLDKLVAVIGQLPTFTKKPKPVSSQ